MPLSSTCPTNFSSSVSKRSVQEEIQHYSVIVKSKLTHKGLREMNMGKGKKMEHYMMRGKKKKQQKPAEEQKQPQPT
jgi:hypothetical protein